MSEQGENKRPLVTRASALEMVFAVAACGSSIPSGYRQDLAFARRNDLLQVEAEALPDDVRVMCSLGEPDMRVINAARRVRDRFRLSPDGSMAPLLAIPPPPPDGSVTAAAAQ